jgi:hypothetical protein
MSGMSRASNRHRGTVPKGLSLQMPASDYVFRVEAEAGRLMVTRFRHPTGTVPKGLSL